MAHKQLTDREPKNEVAQRYQIETLNAEGYTQTEIARVLKRSPSTIQRELARNSDAKGYRGGLAIKRTDKRRRGAKKKIKLDTPMRSMIKSLLGEYYSPEQISGRLKLALGVEISHETIYKHIWGDKENGGDLHKFLRTNGKRYRKRGSGKDKRGQIKNAVSIDDRPAIVEEKSRIGDWEIDTVIGKNHKQALVTIVERKSKFTVMRNRGTRSCKVENKTAELVTSLRLFGAIAAATIELLRPYKDLVFTITADNGKEFACHEKVSKALECDYYFAHPYSSWERGLNENTNGLIRQFFPKGSRFEELTERSVKRAKGLLNRRPRKTLGFATPTEVFFGKAFGENFAFQG